MTGSRSGLLFGIGAVVFWLWTDHEPKTRVVASGEPVKRVEEPLKRLGAPPSVSTVICQKRDGTLTDRCDGSDQVVKPRSDAVQMVTGRGFACTELLHESYSTQLAAVKLKAHYSGLALTPACVAQVLLPEVLRGCRDGSQVDGDMVQEFCRTKGL